MAFEADEQRILGVADALGEAGLSMDDFPIFETCGIVPVLGDDQERRLFGHGGAELVLDNAGDATAIIAMPSELAIAAVVEARRRGIDVPGKLSIATMDDAPEVSQTDPPLRRFPCRQSRRAERRQGSCLKTGRRGRWSPGQSGHPGLDRATATLGPPLRWPPTATGIKPQLFSF